MIEPIIKINGVWVINPESLTHRRQKMLTIGVRKVSPIEATTKIMNSLLSDYKEKISTINGYRNRFKENGLLKYWEGDIVFVTRQEIMEFDLVLQNGKEVKYNASAVSKLARLFQRREGLNLSIAMKHAWFWARRMWREATWNGFNPEGFYAKRISKENYAIDMRKQQLPPEEVDYTEYNKFFKTWQRIHRSLICDDERHAPREISHHWVCNIGNRFMHPRYGECEVIEHKHRRTKGWFIVYQPLDGSKPREVTFPKFRGEVISKDWPITTPVNKLCLTDWGMIPIYQGPDGIKQTSQIR